MFTNEIKIMLYVDDVEKMQRFGEQLALRKRSSRNGWDAYN